MAFKIDHSNTGFKPLEEGEYEVFPTVFDYKISSNGNEMVVFNYKVRDDVEQEGKGQEIRFDNFVDSEGAAWRVNAASKAAGMEHGVEYDSIKEWAEAFKGRALKVVVGHREHNGKTYPEVRSFKESEVGGSLASQPEGQALDISDDDMPF